ncbi:MAG: hypothetical protein M1830_009974 [Pleopsidium flavum]|nr:MAG: hypothetical protein M1830_009974 [Pleopsidium flavum]
MSTKPDDVDPEAAQKARGRLDRIFSRLPRFLSRYTTPLRNAPITHITSFLLLHELTAVLPLFALAGFFHYSRWMPPLVSEGKWVSDGVERFGNYFRRKGWLGDEKKRRYKWWGRGEGTTRLVVEFATAYAITKALLPVRLIFSVWATPWFARLTVIPFINGFRRIWRRRAKGFVPSAAAGTGAVGAGVIAREAPGTVGPLKTAAGITKEADTGVKIPPS